MKNKSEPVTSGARARTSETAEPEARLVERAHAELRAALLRCEFEPGTRLWLDAMCQRFGISANPMRAALNRLVEQGWVKTEGRRGFQVASLSLEGIADLTRARVLIECELLRDAMLHGNDAWEAAMVAAAHALRLAEQRLGDLPPILDEAWCVRHREFHLALYTGARSPLLLGMATGLFDSAERYRQYAARHRAPRRTTADQHPSLLNAVLARDHALAQALLREHIASTEAGVRVCMSGEAGQV